MPLYHDTEEATEEMLHLWHHVFGDLTGYYLMTFTGKQSSVKENDLVDTEQLSWQWPPDASAAAEYLLEESGVRRASDA
jgi:hypothetical protein